MTALVAVVGPGDTADEMLLEVAYDVGAEIARRSALLVCGGLGGVMAAACRGAKANGGTTVGLLPGDNRSTANEWVDVALATGLGEGRNLVLVRAADGVVAVGGSWGTLTEVALACRLGKPVVAVHGWSVVGADDAPIAGAPAVANDARAALDVIFATLR